MYAKWALAPSGFYIAVVEFNNKHYYSYGRTPDHLEKNIATRMYQTERVSTSQVHLEQNRSDQIDLKWASKMFMSKYVRAKTNAQPAVIKNVLMSAPKPPVEYICEEKDGEMIVYEMKEVARYKMHKSKDVEARVIQAEEYIPNGTIINTEVE
jgi:hypothetical protein